jgi:hypothetical protein
VHELAWTDDDVCDRDRGNGHGSAVCRHSLAVTSGALAGTSNPPFKVKVVGPLPNGKPELSSSSPTGLPPSAIQSVYSLSGLSPSSGAGADQVIAIVDAYHDPHALSDLNTFNAQYGYPQLSTCSRCQECSGSRGGDLGNHGTGWFGEVLADTFHVAAEGWSRRLRARSRVEARPSGAGRARERQKQFGRLWMPRERHPTCTVHFVRAVENLAPVCMLAGIDRMSRPRYGSIVAARPLTSVQARSTSAEGRVTGGQIAPGAARGFAVSVCAGALGYCAAPMVVLSELISGLAGNW